MSEKEILCDLIKKYIEIANKNNTTIDDYMSIIALIKTLQIEYKEYAGDFQKYLDLFKKNGILDEYQSYFKSVPKQIFINNHFKKNIDLAYNMLYDFFEGCTSRFMHFLIIFGLCGKPITKKQKYIMAHLFEANSASFSKQTIYYTNLYLKSGLLISNNNYSFLERMNTPKMEQYRFYKLLSEAYIKEKDYLKAIDCLNIAIKKVKSLYKTMLNKKVIIKNLNERLAYVNFKIKYPYIRKELLEKFNIDIKTFNNITENIKDNIDYKLNGGYSEKIIEYLEEKLKD